jgi:hypothetical protein
MRAALNRWTLSVVLLCLPLVALVGCDEGDHHGGGFDVDSILAIIYAIGDVVVSIIQSAS